MPKKKQADASMTGATNKVGDAIQDASYHGDTTISEIDAMVESNLASIKTQDKKNQ